MKKLIIYISIIIFTYFSKGVFAEEIPSSFSLPTTIEEKAIFDPLSLPMWSPYAPTTSMIIIESGSSFARFILPFATPTAGQIKEALTENDPQPRYTDDEFPINPDSPTYSPLVGYEEILYEMEFTNSEQTPIYPDTVMFIKIPEWLSYTENTFALNDSKLSDKDDDDKLIYIEKKSLLKIDLSNHDENEAIKISFNTKILDKEKLENNPLCLVKFESDLDNKFTKWKAFP